MRKPAVISLGFGLVLGFLAVGAQGIDSGAGNSPILGIVLGLLAAAFLYGVMYSNLSARIENEE